MLVRHPRQQDGSVVTWGSRYGGGDSAKVQDQLKRLGGALIKT